MEGFCPQPPVYPSSVVKTELVLPKGMEPSPGQKCCRVHSPITPPDLWAPGGGGDMQTTLYFEIAAGNSKPASFLDKKNNNNKKNVGSCCFSCYNLHNLSCDYDITCWIASIFVNSIFFLQRGRNKICTCMSLSRDLNGHRRIWLSYSQNVGQFIQLFWDFIFYWNTYTIDSFMSIHKVNNSTQHLDQETEHCQFSCFFKQMQPRAGCRHKTPVWASGPCRKYSTLIFIQTAAGSHWGHFNQGASCITFVFKTIPLYSMKNGWAKIQVCRLVTRLLHSSRQRMKIVASRVE